MKTNMAELHHLAKALFMAVELKPVDNLPFVLQHPFATSSMVCVPSDTRGIKEYLEETKQPKLSETSTFVNVISPKGQIVFRNFIFKLIDECKKPMEITILLNKAYYMTFLKYAKPFLSMEDFCEMLKDCWVLQEYPNRDNNVTKKELISWFREVDKEIFMTKNELLGYSRLKRMVNGIGTELYLYRGVSFDGKPDGLSWTTDFATAKWFANRWKNFDGANPKVYRIKITNPNVILACLDTRNENEVILDTSVAKGWEIIE